MKGGLIVHIGYPKTGTTSIQNLLFRNLALNGAIHYLGRSREMDRSTNSGEVVFRKNFLSGKKARDCRAWINPQKVNLLSDEEFSSPDLHLKLKYGAKASVFDFPLFLKDSFPDTDIEIVLVLRKQSDLIYSWYTQYYRYFSALNENAVKEHAFKPDGSFNLKRFYAFDFYALLSSYLKVFGEDRIRIAFFEDLLHRSEKYYDFWGHLLGCSTEEVLQSMSVNRLNTKDKYGRNSVVANLESVPRVIKLTSYLAPRGLKKLVRTQIIDNNSRIKKILSGKSKEPVLIKHFTNSEEKLIMESYRDSNVKLSDKFNIDIEKLRKYKYL